MMTRLAPSFSCWHFLVGWLSIESDKELWSSVLWYSCLLGCPSGQYVIISAPIIHTNSKAMISWYIIIQCINHIYCRQDVEMTSFNFVFYFILRWLYFHLLSLKTIVLIPFPDFCTKTISCCKNLWEIRQYPLVAYKISLPLQCPRM